MDDSQLVFISGKPTGRTVAAFRVGDFVKWEHLHKRDRKMHLNFFLLNKIFVFEVKLL